MEAGQYRFSTGELILNGGILSLPFLVALSCYAAGLKTGMFWALYLSPAFLILISARLDQRRRQIQQLLLKELTVHSDAAYQFGKRFHLQEVTDSKLFPKINTAYSDSQDTPYLATRGNVVFSQISCAVGSVTRGVPTYTHLGDFMFFAMPVHTGSIHSSIIILPDRWKRQFGWRNALRFMGHWPDYGMKALNIPGLMDRYVYLTGTSQPSDGSAARCGIFPYVSQFLNGKNAALLRNVCLSLHAKTFYAVLPVTLKISVCNSRHNVVQMKQYLSQINAVLEALEQWERDLRGWNQVFDPQEM